MTYDRSEQTLAVTWKNGSKGVYYDVSPEKWHGLQTTDSVGGYIQRQLVGAHRYERID